MCFPGSVCKRPILQLTGRPRRSRHRTNRRLGKGLAAGDQCELAVKIHGLRAPPEWAFALAAMLFGPVSVVGLSQYLRCPHNLVSIDAEAERQCRSQLRYKVVAIHINRELLDLISGSECEYRASWNADSPAIGLNGRKRRRVVAIWVGWREPPVLMISTDCRLERYCAAVARYKELWICNV